MLAIFHTIVYQPIYNALIFLYNVIPGEDFGIAIIVITLIFKFLLLPLSKKQIEQQKKLQELQPKIKEIQNRNKDNKEKQTKELMEFYKTNKANPFGGCLPIIFQTILFITFYRVILNLANSGVDVNDLYPFVKNPGEINQFFINIFELSKSISFGINFGSLIFEPFRSWPIVFDIILANFPHFILAILASAAQYFQIKMMMAKAEKEPKEKKEKPDAGDFSQIMNKQMLYLGPGLTLVFGMTFPAGLALYWLVSTTFMIWQQWHLAKKDPVLKITK